MHSNTMKDAHVSRTVIMHTHTLLRQPIVTAVTSVNHKHLPRFYYRFCCFHHSSQVAVVLAFVFGNHQIFFGRGKKLEASERKVEATRAYVRCESRLEAGKYFWS